MAYGDYIIVCRDCGVEFLSGQPHARRCRVCKKNRYKSNPREKFVIFRRDEFRCIYCGVSSIENNERLHLDHIIPKDKGGESRASNIVTCCSDCNYSKHASILGHALLERILDEIKRRNTIKGVDENQMICFR